MEWNPNKTGTLGLEWWVEGEGGVTLDSNLKAAAISFEQSTSQAIGSIRVGVGAIPTRGGLYVVEAYDGATAVTAGVATLTARPNEDVSGASALGWHEQDGTTTTIYSAIDDATLDLADYITIPAPTVPNILYSGRMDTGGLSLTGKRILSVKVGLVINVTGSASLQVALNIGGVSYSGPSYSNADGFQGFSWYYNPATKKPWTIADVQAFDTTDEYVLSGYIGNPAGECSVYWVWMEVTVATENRLAVGTLDDTASALTVNAYNIATVTTPTGGTWTKDASGRHTYVVRRINATGALVVPYLTASLTSQANLDGWTPVLDPTYGYVTAMGDGHNALIPVIQRTTAPADSVDSQPYYDLFEALVFTGQDAEQEISGAAATAYGVVRFMVKENSAASDLLLKVKRRSDNVQLGGTFTLAVADIGNYPVIANGWRFVIGQLASSATLAGATQYYLEFSSAAAGTLGNYWSIAAVDTTNVGNSATFGGTTDRALVNSSEADRYDLAGVTLSTVPATIANVTATETFGATTPGVCDIATYNHLALGWTASVLGASFLYYEIQRQTTGCPQLTGWHTLVYIGTEATNVWADYEAPRGVVSEYRIRVLRTDGAQSNWSAVPSATRTVDGPALYFMSNYDEAFNLVYHHEPTVGYSFGAAAELVAHPIYGRDYQLAFQPLEEIGATLQWQIPVGFDGAGPGFGITAFAALRATAHAGLPYVCVLDQYANCVFVALVVPEGIQQNPAERYVATVLGVEVTDIPYPATV